jgi:flagella basal body P-ring formation protein FlgA
VRDFKKIAALVSYLPCIACASESSVLDWQGVAERVLLPALHSAYPDVVDWAVEPLVGKRQAGVLASGESFEAVVVRVGKRSAVRLQSRAGAKAGGSTVWFAVRGVQPVLTAKSTIQAREPLRPELSDYVPQDVVALACTPIGSAQALTGMRARKSIREGAAICAESIEPRPAVGRGQEVTVISTAGAVVITGRAIAQQDGAVGTVLRVKSPSSGQVYSVAVTGEREVAVHE